jgi:hypothetical protein
MQNFVVYCETMQQASIIVHLQTIFSKGRTVFISPKRYYRFSYDNKIDPIGKSEFRKTYEDWDNYHIKIIYDSFDEFFIHFKSQKQINIEI